MQSSAVVLHSRGTLEVDTSESSHHVLETGAMLKDVSLCLVLSRDFSASKLFFISLISDRPPAARQPRPALAGASLPPALLPGTCVTPSAVKKLLRFSMSPLTIKKFVFFFVLQHFPSGKFVQRPKNVPFYIFNQKSYFHVFWNGLPFIEIVL